jgi:hypothetical protein
MGRYASTYRARSGVGYGMRGQGNYKKFLRKALRYGGAIAGGISAVASGGNPLAGGRAGYEAGSNAAKVFGLGRYRRGRKPYRRAIKSSVRRKQYTRYSNYGGRRNIKFGQRTHGIPSSVVMNFKHHEGMKKFNNVDNIGDIYVTGVPGTVTGFQQTKIVVNVGNASLFPKMVGIAKLHEMYALHGCMLNVVPTFRVDSGAVGDIVVTSHTDSSFSGYQSIESMKQNHGSVTIGTGSPASVGIETDEKHILGNKLKRVSAVSREEKNENPENNYGAIFIGTKGWLIPGSGTAEVTVRVASLSWAYNAVLQDFNQDLHTTGATLGSSNFKGYGFDTANTSMVAKSKEVWERTPELQKLYKQPVTTGAFLANKANSLGVTCKELNTAVSGANTRRTFKIQFPTETHEGFFMFLMRGQTTNATNAADLMSLDLKNESGIKILGPLRDQNGVGDTGGFLFKDLSPSKAHGISFTFKIERDSVSSGASFEIEYDNMSTFGLSDYYETDINIIPVNASLFDSTLSIN